MVDYRRSLLGEVPRSTWSTTSPPPPRPSPRCGPGVLPPGPIPARTSRRPAAQPLVVERRGGVRARRRLRPGRPSRARRSRPWRHCCRRPATSVCTSWSRAAPGRLAGALRAGDPVVARPGDARAALLSGSPDEGPLLGTQAAARTARPRVGSSPATGVSTSSRWRGASRRCSGAGARTGRRPAPAGLRRLPADVSRSARPGTRPAGGFRADKTSSSRVGRRRPPTKLARRRRPPLPPRTLPGCPAGPTGRT